MIYIETEKEIYKKFKVLLPEFQPGIFVELISEDPKLQAIELSETIPCIISLNLSLLDYETLLDDLLALEVDAFNTPNGEDPSPTDPAFIRYKRYGWIWNYLQDKDFRLG